MTLLTEMLLPFSVEEFLSDDEVARVLASIDAFKAANPIRLEAGAAGITIHKSPGLTVAEVVAVYEPEGRLDINTQHIPADVVDIVETAFYRRIEDIRRAYPGTFGPYGFTYVEYAAGQYFTPHIDGSGGRQVAGFGVTLTDDFEGGEFIIETCGSNRLWATGPNGDLDVAPGHDARSGWYRSLPKTQWTTRPRRGGALFYGSALTHGSRPVTRGVLKKVLAFISR